MAHETNNELFVIYAQASGLNMTAEPGEHSDHMHFELPGCRGRVLARARRGS
jgi:hypothetical protein